MSTIRILPEILSNKIAAGEVVERPVSIVKELIENSLDAGASRISVEVLKGGRDLVRVSDDGHGMSREDALLCIERYATSKIFTDDDLFAIKTFGFRGEAIPSIASVSKFVLTTRQKNSDTGTRLVINGGKLMDVTETGAPPGTMVDVRNLYFNTPARRKFLKSISTEMSHIGEAFSGFALANPGTGFRLVHNDRLVKQYLPADERRQRAAEVLGVDGEQKLLEISHAVGSIRVAGYISSPEITRSTSQKIQIFVNQRMVGDRGILSALFRGYRGRIMKGRFPLAVLFLTLPFDQVDVNVHPAKLQVRFVDQNQVYAAVDQAVFKTLAAAAHPLSGQANMKTSVLYPVADSEVESEKSLPKLQELSEKRKPWESVKPVVNVDYSESENLTADIDDHNVSVSKKAAVSIEQELIQNPVPDRLAPDQSMPKPEADQFLEKSLDPSISKENFHIIGQVFGTYVLVESEAGLFLIDQHAAHERIVYERLKRRASRFRPPSQQLMVPEILELGYREADILEKILPDLGEFGFSVEPFGGTTFIIKAVPAIIDDRNIQAVLTEMIETIIESGTDTGNQVMKEAWMDRCLMVMACHTTLRAKQTLNPMEMKSLVEDLARCENPDHCPHGRPTRLLWTASQIEKLFKRLV